MGINYEMILFSLSLICLYAVLDINRGTGHFLNDLSIFLSAKLKFNVEREMVCVQKKHF